MPKKKNVALTIPELVLLRVGLRQAMLGGSDRTGDNMESLAMDCGRRKRHGLHWLDRGVCE